MISRRATERRLTFGRVAELYEQVRPSYPRQLVEVVLDYAALEPADRILDVGAGTGKATRQFAARGHPVVALEPSAEMAAVARSTTGDLPSITVVPAEFERWTTPSTPFKLLISAQAWHCIDPEVRYAKARAVLKPGGAIAAFWSHADWHSAALGPALDQAYRETAPECAPTGRCTRGLARVIWSGTGRPRSTPRTDSRARRFAASRGATPTPPANMCGWYRRTPTTSCSTPKSALPSGTNSLDLLR